MTKVIAIPNSLDYKKMSNITDAYLFGLENMSVNFKSTISLNELKKVIEEINDKEIFVSLNKNMHNSDLESLELILKELDKMNIAGIFYYDIALLSLKEKLGLKTNLVWSAEHLTTNYATINFYQKFGVNYTYISSEITLEEIINIKKNTTSKLIVPIFGYLPMFVSERHLVKNYLKTFNLKDNSNINYMNKEKNNYPVLDNELGTTIYSSHILNGFNEYKILEENNIDYVTINSFGINEDSYLKILENFKNRVSSEEEINILLEADSDKGFLYKETIYKVKNND